MPIFYTLFLLFTYCEKRVWNITFDKTYPKNVALAYSGTATTAITVGSYNDITQHPVYAIHRDRISYWASNWSLPGWVQVEYNKIHSISKVGVWWSGCQHSFTISLSLDAENWTIVVPSRLSGYNQEAQFMNFTIFHQ